MAQGAESGARASRAHGRERERMRVRLWQSSLFGLRLAFYNWALLYPIDAQPSTRPELSFRLPRAGELPDVSEGEIAVISGDPTKRHAVTIQVGSVAVVPSTKAIAPPPGAPVYGDPRPWGLRPARDPSGSVRPGPRWALARLNVLLAGIVGTAAISALVLAGFDLPGLAPSVAGIAVGLLVCGAASVASRLALIRGARSAARSNSTRDMRVVTWMGATLGGLIVDWVSVYPHDAEFGTRPTVSFPVFNLPESLKPRDGEAVRVHGNPTPRRAVVVETARMLVWPTGRCRATLGPGLRD